MAYDDEGVWNTLAPTAPMGTTIMNYTGFKAAIESNGVPTLIQVIFNGEAIDFGGLRFMVK